MLVQGGPWTYMPSSIFVPKIIFLSIVVCAQRAEEPTKGLRKHENENYYQTTPSRCWVRVAPGHTYIVLFLYQKSYFYLLSFRSYKHLTVFGQTHQNPIFECPVQLLPLH